MAGIDPWNLDDHFLYDHDGEPCPPSCPAYEPSDEEVQAALVARRHRRARMYSRIMVLFFQAFLVGSLMLLFYFAYIYL